MDSPHVSDEDSTATIVVSGITVGLATIAVALRFFVRIRMKVYIGWDDWWILIGLLTTLLSGGLLVAGNGIDPEGAQFSTEAANNPEKSYDYAPHVPYLKLSFASSIFYFLLITGIKTSILLLYRRVFAIDSSFRFQSLMAMSLVWVFWFCVTITTILNCLPFEYNWMSIGDPHHCINYNIFWMVAGSLEVVIDIIILALPVRMVLGLQLTRKRKVMVLFIFLLGGFVIITGIIRVIYGYVPGSRLPSYGKAETWSSVHVGTAIICACLPTLRPLFFRSSSDRSSSARRRYYGIRGWNGKGVVSTGESGGSGAGNIVEAIPLRSQESQPSRVKIPRAETAWLPEERLGDRLGEL